MEELKNKIKGAVIPTGGSNKQDITRCKAIEKYLKEKNISVPLIISGCGPDTNEVLEKGYNEKLDFHKKLYNYFIDKDNKIFGIDTKSMNSIENILYTFPYGTTGKYLMSSYPLHLRRFKKIEKIAKKKGKISKELEIEYVPTKQNLKEIVYEIVAFTKFYFKGKSEYFSD